jgi:hypothetical protein
MRTKMLLVGAAALMGTLLATNLQGQPGHGAGRSGGWGAGDGYVRSFNPKTVETATGEVLKIDRFKPGKGMSDGVHLQLKTDQETISVHLGPAWYIDNQDTKIEANDKLIVKGSRVTFDGKPALIAAEVVKGDEVLRLRDKDGIPVWAGWRRR